MRRWSSFARGRRVFSRPKPIVVSTLPPSEIPAEALVVDPCEERYEEMANLVDRLIRGIEAEIERVKVDDDLAPAARLNFRHRGWQAGVYDARGVTYAHLVALLHDATCSTCRSGTTTSTLDEWLVDEEEVRDRG